MHYGASSTVFKFAQQLRNNLTDSEVKLWFLIKEQLRDHHFRRQHPISHYIADFYCHHKKLVIEIDGTIHNLPEVAANDEVRQQDLEALGLKVLRFSTKDIMHNSVFVLEKIKTALNCQSSVPL